MKRKIVIKINGEKAKFQTYEDAIEYLKAQGDIEDKDMTYDCQDMPDDVRRAFFNYHDAGNDCHVSHTVEAGTKVGDYLIEEGFEDGDDLIIKHWW